MKLSNILLAAVVTVTSLWAEQELTVNGGAKIGKASIDEPAVWYLNGHIPNENLTVYARDLHADAGPGMKFKIEVYGTQANGVGFEAVSEGDFPLVVPGGIVGEHTVLVVYDMNRYNRLPQNAYNEWQPADMSIEVLQDSYEVPELEVFTKDHHLGNPSIYVLATKVQNVGSLAVKDFTLRYYLSVEDASQVPTVFDYYTPVSDVKLLQVPGTFEYALEVSYTGTTLSEGESTSGAVENQIHISYPGYAAIDKQNDFSNPVPTEISHLPSSTLYALNNKVSVYDSKGTLISGMTHPTYRYGQFVEVK